MDHECTSSLSSIEILRGDDWDHTGELCGGGGVSGCIQVSADSSVLVVYTKDDEERYVLYHEFAHWALWCSNGSVDGNHKKREIWDWIAEVTGAKNRV